MSKTLALGEVRCFRYSFIHTGEKEAEASEVAGGRSEVCLLLCDGCYGPIALEFGVTVINHHRPWACPKLAPHFQISTGGRQLPEFLRQRPLCLPHLDGDPERDAEHGGQGHEPADAVAPGGVSVDVVVLERLVLNQEENEDARTDPGGHNLPAPFNE